MRVFHWKGKHPNFGDDMNLFLWKHFAPDLTEKDDNLLLVGVGTVLSDRLPQADARVILGSGAGYGVLPADPASENWVVYGVRGPLTARLLGFGSELAAVDPAVLLPLMDVFAAKPSGQRVFVPHWLTAIDPLWQEAARAAGLVWVDPRQEPEVVIQQIIDADIVVAESMHGAIVADAFGVPWIPVICTHAAMFKWQDWAASLQMAYRPYRVGPFALVQGLIQRFRTPPVPRFREPGVCPSNPADRHGGSLAVAPRGRSANLMLNILSHMPRSTLVALLASRLRKLAAGEGVLSDRTILRERQNDLLRRLDRLRADYSAGAFDSYAQALPNRSPNPEPAAGGI